MVSPRPLPEWGLRHRTRPFKHSFARGYNLWFALGRLLQDRANHTDFVDDELEHGNAMKVTRVRPSAQDAPLAKR
jgi:hypothetical protein